MSKKLTSGPYDYNDDEDYVPTKKVKYDSKDVIYDPTQKKQHTLDSDEEDEDTKVQEKNYDILQDEDIDGQEDSTIDFEGDTKITPFNMKEELEEGHFDKEGFYHFKKDKEELKDAWLDNIDWVKIKHLEEGINKYGSDNDSSDSEGRIKSKAELDLEKKVENDLYEKLIPYLKPQETVALALKRLGSCKNQKRLTTAEKWKLKKQGKLDSLNDTNKMEEFMKLTEITNDLVANGNMDIYEESYEMISLKIQRWKTSNAPPLGVSGPAVDIFAEEVSTSTSETVNSNRESIIGDDQTISSSTNQDIDDKTITSTNQETKIDDNAILWEYQWEDDTEIHGPYTTDQMITWQDSNYFEKGALIRKVQGTEGQWYKSSRVDFELYT